MEGFGGKRVLGFLLKSELCQKRSRFRNDAVLFMWFKQCSACFFPEVCFLFEILRMRKTHFSKAILWGPFVERKTKEAFSFAKPWSQYNTWISYYCFVSTSGWGAERSGVEFVLSWRRLGTRWRSVQFFFLCRSLSLHFSKPKISIYLRVFVIESSFLIAWNGLGIVNYGLGWIHVCLLAGIVTSTFGAQSINYFHNTNSELTCELSRVCSLFPPIFEVYLRNICNRLVGDLASLSLWSSIKSHQHASKNRGVFLFRDGLSPPFT